MIIPEKDNDPKKNYYSASVTAAVCFLAYIILIISSIADPDTTRIEMTELTELNITSFQPKIEEPVEEPMEEPPAQEEATAETEIEVETPAPQRVDMSEILPEGVRVDLSVPENERPRTARTEVTQEAESRSLRMSDTELERSGMRSLSGNNLSTPNTERRSLSAGGDDSGGGIDLAESGGLTSGRRSLSETGGGSLLDGPQVRDGNEQGREVGLRNLSDFGDNYSDMDPIYNDLVRWMKENPAELPLAVQRTMGDGRWDPNYLTSRVPFYIDDRSFDLLLMVKEADVEVHIFLVESMEDATYLIDSGFRGQSSSLRVGDVEYHNNDIAEIGSRMRRARTEDTEEFYQIFRSWWETVEI